MALTHKQRVERALAHQETDRIAYSMWMHFPNRDRHPRRLAELSLANQVKYDLDFIKFMPFGMYSPSDFGVDLDVFPGYTEAPVLHAPIIKDVKDWDKIHFVPGTAGEYAVVLEAQQLLFEMMDERIPFLQTVFSPMTTLAKMCSPKVLVEHLRQDPARIHRALEIVTATTLEFMKASVELGADGFFFASQLSGEDAMTSEEHTAFVKYYDKELLKATASQTWFNVLHLHGPKVRLKEVQDYPVQGLSWHDRDDGPSMDEVRSYSDKTFVGGLSWGSNWLGKTDEEVTAEVREVASRHDGKGIILGPGCVIAPQTPESRLQLVHSTVVECTRSCCRC